MSVRATATLIEVEGRPSLCFERRLPHPPQRVWEALTQTAELRRWHPTPFALDPEVGGRVSFHAEPGGPQMPQGEVLEFEPPRLLAHTWGEDLLRWELRPEGEGCLLILTQTFDDRMKAARDAAGWDLCLDALDAGLQGADPPEQGEAPRMPDGWRELNGEYERRFGIDPARATPPPQ